MSHYVTGETKPCVHCGEDATVWTPTCQRCLTPGTDIPKDAKVEAAMMRVVSVLVSDWEHEPYPGTFRHTTACPICDLWEAVARRDAAPASPATATRVSDLTCRSGEERKMKPGGDGRWDCPCGVSVYVSLDSHTCPQCCSEPCRCLEEAP